MRLHLPGRRGGTRLERVAAIVLFGIFLTVILGRTLQYQEHAEKMAMELTVRNIRTGLRFKIADLLMNKQSSRIALLADENPINWLGRPPENYLGEYNNAPAGLVPGNWYFDSRNGHLVYLVKHRRHFAIDAQDDSVRYRAARHTSGARTGAPKGETWVSFSPLREYRWQP
jgi:hypothetical protein